MNMLLERISNKMVIIVSRHLAQGKDRWDKHNNYGFFVAPHTFSTENRSMGRGSNTMVIIVSIHLLQGTNRWEECQTQCSSLYQDI
jgi:hypothetical protein